MEIFFVGTILGQMSVFEGKNYWGQFNLILGLSKHFCNLLDIYYIRNRFKNNNMVHYVKKLITVS